MENFPQPFGAWVLARMRDRGISGRQLAQRAGVDHSTISRLIRSGRSPSYETARKLAHVLESDPMNTRTIEEAVRRDPVLTDEDIEYLLAEYRRLRVDRIRRRSVRRTAG